MTKLYLIRHAEAEGNLYRRIHGHYDGAITAMGKKQVEALKKRFEAVPVDAVYSSDLSRARDTAAAIYLPKGLEVHETPLLREVCMGVWEDKCWGWAERFDSEQLHNFNFAPDKWAVEGSEPYDKTMERIESALRLIAAENEGKTVAAVSHGSVIRVLLAKLLGWSPSEVRKVLYCDNTAVALLNIDGGKIELEYYNDNSHLPDEISAFHRDTWWKKDDARDGRDMYFLPMDVHKKGEEYLRRYRDAWINSHDNDDDFSPIYLEWARRRYSADPETVMDAYLGETPCGMLELAVSSGASNGFGHIALIYLEKEYRGRGLAVQLLGQAVSYYKKQGRKNLRLRVSESNLTARKFYERHGFEVTGRETDGFGTTLTMCRPI